MAQRIFSHYPTAFRPDDEFIGVSPLGAWWKDARIALSVLPPSDPMFRAESQFDKGYLELIVTELAARGPARISTIIALLLQAGIESDLLARANIARLLKYGVLSTARAAALAAD
jgi:hypothetical protein